jgi:hypothetical protein
MRLRDFSRYKSCVVIKIKTNKTLPKQLYQIWFWGLLAFLTDFCIKLAINGVCELVALPLNSIKIMAKIQIMVTIVTH